MSFESLENKTVLVTGGARGIGKGLARACLEEGAKVIITSLHAETGEAAVAELSGLGAVRAIPCDAREPEAIDHMLDDIWAKEGSPDVVFSNAGAGGSERVLEAPLAEVHALFATNFESSLHVAQRCIPRMIQEDRPGHVMFTGSEHSVGLPAGNEDLGFAFYGATKHAMLITAEWLRADLAGTQVSVSLLMPGPVLTEGVAGAFQMLDEDPDHPAVRPQFSHQVESLLRQRVITTAECAAIALRGMRAGLFYIPTQPHIKQDIDRRHVELMSAFESLGLG